jgi:hypothetical protein
MEGVCARFPPRKEKAPRKAKKSGITLSNKQYARDETQRGTEPCPTAFHFTSLYKYILYSGCEAWHEYI